MDWFIKRITNPFFTTVSLQKMHMPKESILNAWLLRYRENSHHKTTAQTHIQSARNPEKSTKQEATVDCGDMFNRQACKLYCCVQFNSESLNLQPTTWNVTEHHLMSDFQLGSSGWNLKKKKKDLKRACAVLYMYSIQDYLKLFPSSSANVM